MTPSKDNLNPANSTDLTSASGQSSTPPAGTYAGNVYGINSAGDLYFYQDLARNGLRYWANKGTGQKIGNGWGFRQVFSGGAGIIYAIDTTGYLHFYQDLARNGTANWAASSSQIIGNGWNFKQVFSGRNGVIYAIDTSGNLYFYQDLARNGTQNWASNSGQIIGNGWNFSQVFSGSNGVIYAVDSSGNLYFYKDVAQNGTRNWDPNSGRVIGTAWKFTQVFSGGNGVIYAIDSVGNLFFYQDLAQNGSANWFHGGSGRLIGSGWKNFSFAMADDADTSFVASIKSQSWARPIQGYSTPLSVSPGDQIQFRVRASAPQFVVNFLRLKKQSGGDGDASISMEPSFSVSGRLQPINSIYVWETGCNWDPDFSLTVPSTWSSGLYAAKCLDSNNNVFCIPFIVKPSASNKKAMAVLASTNTWNAYNDWGGRSNYTQPNGVILSLERPNPAAVPNDGASRTATSGAPSNPNHRLLAELWILSWLENSGYQFDVYAELDFHANPSQFSTYNAIILNTHPEYWTVVMRGNMVQYLSQANKKLIYLGGNGIFESVDYADDYGPTNSRMKLRGGDPTADRTPFRFRNLTPTPLPERAVLGVAYEAINYFSFATYKVLQQQHRFFRGTNLLNGNSFGQMGLNGAASGWEMDTATGVGHVSNIQVLATGENVTTNPQNQQVFYGADMAYYETASGGFVFSVGSLSFGGALAVDPTLQTIVKNVLSECV